MQAPAYPRTATSDYPTPVTRGEKILAVCAIAFLIACAIVTIAQTAIYLERVL